MMRSARSGAGETHSFNAYMCLTCLAKTMRSEIHRNAAFNLGVSLALFLLESVPHHKGGMEPCQTERFL